VSLDPISNIRLHEKKDLILFGRSEEFWDLYGFKNLSVGTCGNIWFLS